MAGMHTLTPTVMGGRHGPPQVDSTPDSSFWAPFGLTSPQLGVNLASSEQSNPSVGLRNSEPAPGSVRVGFTGLLEIIVLDRGELGSDRSA